MLSLGTGLSGAEEEASSVQLNATVQFFCDLASCGVASSSHSVIFQKKGIFSGNAVRTSNTTLITCKIHLQLLIYSQFFRFCWQFHCKISAASKQFVYLLYSQKARDLLKVKLLLREKRNFLWQDGSANGR
jgi:hypothetical protein